MGRGCVRFKARPSKEGILPGGGVALLRAAEELEKVRTHNDDQKTRSEPRHPRQHGTTATDTIAYVAADQNGLTSTPPAPSYWRLRFDLRSKNGAKKFD